MFKSKISYLPKAIGLSVILFLSLLTNPSGAEIRLDNWQTLSSLYNVSSASIDSKGRIWTGTLGGIFVYTEQDSTIVELRTTEGLRSLEVTALKCLPERKQVFVGTKDGYLSISDEDFHWTHITDILSSKFTNSSVNDFIFKDSIAFIAGGFGIGVFDMNNLVFRETVLKLGTYQQNTTINKILISQNYLWAATELGIAKAPLGNTLADPKTWKNYQLADKSIGANSIIELDGAVYASDKRNVYKFENDTFKIIKSYPNDYDIRSIGVINNKIFITSMYFISDMVGLQIGGSHPSVSLKGFLSNNGKVIVYYEDSGIGIIRNDSVYNVKPNTPQVNQFLNMTLDNRANLWVATDRPPTGYGFMFDDNGKWKNYLGQKLAFMETNSYFKVSANKNSQVMLSSWARGLQIANYSDTGYVFTLYNNLNTPMTGIASNPNFVIAGESVTDDNGTVWAVNYGESSQGPVLVAMDRNNVWHSFNNLINPTYRYYVNMTIDANGTKWLGTDGADDKGLLYYNERGTLDDKSDDICGEIVLSSYPSLLDNNIKCLVTDKTGTVWIGTPSGLTTILNPSAVLNKSKVILRKISLIGIKQVNSIMVDAVNNKWIATPDGVWVLNADGTEVLATLTSENSGLIATDVRSITTNPENGLIYFGTKKGLSTANSLFVEPLEQYKLSCYPQPFRVPEDEDLVIEGLETDSQIHIATINGERIRGISTYSRKALWDGRDEKRNLVESGVYLILVDSPTNGSSAVGKLTVIRK